MERHDDDLTTAEPDNLPASADTVEPEWREQADAGAESEAASPEPLACARLGSADITLGYVFQDCPRVKMPAKPANPAFTP